MTDIVDSTKLVSAIGDDRFADLVERHDELLLAALRSRGGELIRTQGDGMLVAFVSSADAHQWILDVHHEVQVELDVQLRVGGHYGPVVVRQSDYVGMTIHIAARLSDKAPPGQVLVTADFAQRTGVLDPVGDDIRLRGVPEPVEVVRVHTNGSVAGRCSAPTDDEDRRGVEDIVVSLKLLDPGPSLGRRLPSLQVPV